MILDFPSITPSLQSWGIEYNTQQFQSPFSGAVQTAELAGARWKVDLQFNALPPASYRVMMAFLTKCRGMSGRFYLHDHVHPTVSGAASGTINIRRNGTVNSGFPTDINSWATDTNGGGGSITWDATGKLKFTQGGSSVWMGAYQPIPTIIGETYYVTATSSVAAANVGIIATTTSSNPAGLSGGLGSDSNATSLAFSFVATTSTTYIWMMDGQSAASTSLFDDTRVNFTTVPLTNTFADGSFVTGQTIFAAGDMIEFDDQLHMVTSDAVADSSNRISIDFEPPHRQIPTDNAEITYSSPKGIFQLMNNTITSSNIRPNFSNISFSCIEAYGTAFNASGWS